MLMTLAIAVGPVWLNSFIHSNSFRGEVEARAGQSLGGTVKIDSIDFSLWSGLRLHGLDTEIEPNRASSQGAVVAKIEAVSCSCSWLQLLHRRLELTGVTLDQPQVVVTRQPEVATGENGASGAGDSSPAPGGKTTPFQFVLSALKIKDGALSVRDAAGAALADLTGIQLSARNKGDEGEDVEGTLRVARVLLPSHLLLTDFSTPFTYKPGSATADPFEAAAFGGRLAGDYALGLAGPSLLDLNGKGLDTAQIAQAMNSSAPPRVTGALDLQSKWRGVEAGRLDGEGDAQLRGGKLQGVPLLHDLAGILRIKELESPELRTAQTHFQVANGLTRFTGLQLDAGLFGLTGDGTIGAAGALNANLVLILTRDAVGRMPREVAMFFVQKQDGSASIAFHVGGSLAQPRTDLATRVLLGGAHTQTIITNALDRFFKKHKSAPAPAATSSPPAPTGP